MLSSRVTDMCVVSVFILVCIISEAEIRPYSLACACDRDLHLGHIPLHSLLFVSAAAERAHTNTLSMFVMPLWLRVLLLRSLVLQSGVHPLLPAERITLCKIDHYRARDRAQKCLHVLVPSNIFVLQCLYAFLTKWRTFMAAHGARCTSTDSTV